MTALRFHTVGGGEDIRHPWSPFGEEQCKNIEKGMIMYNTHRALTRTKQHKSAVIDYSSGNILTESTAVLNWWTEYCSSLYNYKLHPDTRLLQSNQIPTQEAESRPVMREEVEEAVHRLKAEKVSRSG